MSEDWLGGGWQLRLKGLNDDNGDGDDGKVIVWRVSCCRLKQLNKMFYAKFKLLVRCWITRVALHHHHSSSSSTSLLPHGSILHVGYFLIDKVQNFYYLHMFVKDLRLRSTCIFALLAILLVSLSRVKHVSRRTLVGFILSDDSSWMMFCQFVNLGKPYFSWTNFISYIIPSSISSYFILSHPISSHFPSYWHPISYYLILSRLISHQFQYFRNS